MQGQTGTAVSRLRTSAEPVTLGVTLLAHGGPLQALVVACGDDERTVASGVARAGRPGLAGPAQVVEHPRDLGEVQADAIRVKNQGGGVWRALALMVNSTEEKGGFSDAAPGYLTSTARPRLNQE